MPGFSGKHYNSLDPKGRLIVPATFREILSTNHSSKLIITNEVFDRCLSAYPVDEWQKLIDKVNQMPQTSDAVKYFMRRVIGSAIECEIDKQGRVLVSAALRTDAALDSEVVLLAKTTAGRIAELKAKVAEIHSYDCPCILAFDVSEGHPPFMDWISESVSRGAVC